MFHGSGYGTGQHGRQYANEAPLHPSLPQNAPVVAPAMLVGPDDALQQHYTPLGLSLAAPTDGHVVHRVDPVRHGLLYISGVRSLNEPGEVEVLRVVVGNGGDIPRNAAPFDAATYRTARCFCPVDWGCSNLITLTIRGLVPNARLEWTVFGTLQQSWNSCYPSAETVEGQAAAIWGMANGHDPSDPATVAAWKNARSANRPSPRSSAARTLAQRLKRYLEAA